MASVKQIDCFAAWLDTTEDQQMRDLEDYFQTKKISLPSVADPDPVTRLFNIINSCGPLFQEASSTVQDATDAEGVFFSIASLLCIVPPEKTEEVVNLFCQQITSDSVSNAPLKLKLLNLMYVHFTNGDPLKFVVLSNRLKYAANHKLGVLINADVNKAAQWIKECACVRQQSRQVYTFLWEAYKGVNQSLAVKFLVELVKTFNADDAGTGRDYACQLIVELLMDEQQFVFDYMLSLPAVSALKGDPLHKLLEIFVSGKLMDFMEFQTECPTVFGSSGLDYQICLRKIQLLTLVSMATENTEVGFDCLSSELQLEPASVEPTVIEAVRLNLIKAKVDQINEKIIISGAVHRTFTTEQWRVLHGKLSELNKNIETVLRRFETLTSKT